MYCLFLCILLLLIGCRPTPLPTVPAATPTATPVPDSRAYVNGHAALHRPTDRTPREVLEGMVAAYRGARTYSDHGMVRIVGRMSDPDAEPTPWPCTVALERPGKLRLEVNEGVLVCDGEDGFAQIRAMPDQVLRFPCPKRWTLEALFADVWLDRSMDLGVPETVLCFPPQLVLLLADDPLKTLLPDGATAQFLDPQWLGECPCDLIRVTHPGGNRILWVHRADGALLRFDYLVEGLPVPEGVESIRLIRIDLIDAAFDREITPQAFQMMRPVHARTVTEFQPVESRLLGRPLEHYETFRLQQLNVSGENDEGTKKRQDGEDAAAVSFADLADKTVVLCFWASWSESSGAALREAAGLLERFAEDDRIRFLAVNLDNLYPAQSRENGMIELPTGAASEANIRKRLAEWGLSLPVVFDPAGTLAERLGVDSFPTLVVLAPKGRPEFYYRGIVPASTLESTALDVAQGGKPHENALAELALMREEHRAALRSMAESDCYVLLPKPEELRLKPVAAPPQAPSTFYLQEYWSIRTLTAPGNMAILPGRLLPDGTRSAPSLLIPCEGNTLARVDLSGKILEKTKPRGLMNDELLTLVRTGIDGLGQRLIGVSAVSGNAVHVFAADLSPLFSYRPGTSSTSGARQVISDFHFADLDGSGTLSLLLGVIALETPTPAPASGTGDSVRAVDLSGKDIWRDDTVESPFLLESFVAGGERGVYCLDLRDQRSSLLKFDAQGKRLRTIRVEGDRQILWFDADVMSDESRSELCVLLADADGKNFCLASLDEDGRIGWQHTLPGGEFQKPIEQIFAADLLGDVEKEWIVPTPDGTIFVFDRRGNRLDSFAFGEWPTGLAVLADGEKRLLVVADAGAVTAWEVSVGE